MSVSGHELKGPHFVVSTEGEILGEDTASNREIVRRIHACVNACEGISTEELESGIIADMRRVIAELVPVLQNQQKNQPAKSSASPARKIAVENR
ncbi:MAG: hypothetical protein Tsb009_21150 [Planctomycetaceae bacterium]